MQKYRLNINFDAQSLDTIYGCHQRVVLVKHTAEKNYAVAWISFQPFERNFIDWEENFALYASTSNTEHGTRINKMIDTPGECQTNAIFNRGYFGVKEHLKDISPNTYAITNNDNYYNYLIFGLAQSVSVNGTDFNNLPINAVCVPRCRLVTMTPLEKVDVFLQANIGTSAVVNEVSSNALSLVYDGDVEKTVFFDPQSGSFRQATPK
jgi:hypothetical protein